MRVRDIEFKNEAFIFHGGKTPLICFVQYLKEVLKHRSVSYIDEIYCDKTVCIPRLLPGPHLASVPWTRLVNTVGVVHSPSCTLREPVHVLVHLRPRHLGMGAKGKRTRLPEDLLLSLGWLETHVALVKCRCLRATHCLRRRVIFLNINW